MDEEKPIRRANKSFGLPSENTYYSNGKVKYDKANKVWKCTICDYKRNQYNRHQVMRHADSKHGKKLNKQKN